VLGVDGCAAAAEAEGKHGGPRRKHADSIGKPAAIGHVLFSCVCLFIVLLRTEEVGLQPAFTEPASAGPPRAPAFRALRPSPCSQPFSVPSCCLPFVAS
jgi:hypothetical protein